MWGAGQGVEPQRVGRRVGSGARGGGDRVPGDRAPPGGDRVPARPSDHRRPRWLSMCGMAGIVRAGRLAARRRADARCGWPAPSATAARTASGSPSTPAPGWCRPGWRSSTSPAAGSRSRRRPAAACSSTTARSTTTPSCAPSSSARGESFATTCDTEVVLRLLERDGVAALDRLNGQFAFAWWQPRQRRLTLVRDRFGVRPLYYALLDDGTPRLRLRGEGALRLRRGDRGARPGRHRRGVHALGRRGRRGRRSAASARSGPGGLVVWERGRIVEERTWWSPDYAPDGAPDGDLEELLRDSVRLRLRADVPVGTYLSGGLDSSLITALAQAETDHELRTFSIAFRTPATTSAPIRRRWRARSAPATTWSRPGRPRSPTRFPDVVRHAEMPLVRTAPVPLFLLAREVREQAITVVATGEGADELFWGYELFKEVALRELHRHEPERAVELLEQLYSYLGPAAARRGPAWRRFLLETGADDDQLGSHLTRAEATATVKAFYRPEVAAEIGDDRLARSPARRAAAGLRALEPAGARRLARARDPARALPALGAGGPGRDGARGRGPLPVPRSPRVRALRRPAGRAQARRHAREGRAARGRRRRCCRPRSPSAASSRTAPRRSRRSSRPRRPAWVEEPLSPGALAETGIWDAVAGGRPAAALPRRPGDRDARVDGAGRHPLHPALASRVRRQRDQPTIRRRPSEPRIRIDRTSRISDEGGCMTEATGDVRAEMRAYIEENFLYLHPGVELEDGDDFLTLGIVDSLGFVELVEEVQSRYGVDRRRRRDHRGELRLDRRHRRLRRAQANRSLSAPHARRGPARGRRARPGPAARSSRASGR